MQDFIDAPEAMDNIQPPLDLANLLENALKAFNSLPII